MHSRLPTAPPRAGVPGGGRRCPRAAPTLRGSINRLRPHKANSLQAIVRVLRGQRPRQVKTTGRNGSGQAGAEAGTRAGLGTPHSVTRDVSPTPPAPASPRGGRGPPGLLSSGTSATCGERPRLRAREQASSPHSPRKCRAAHTRTPQEPPLPSLTWLIQTHIRPRQVKDPGSRPWEEL